MNTVKIIFVSLLIISSNDYSISQSLTEVSQNFRKSELSDKVINQDNFEDREININISDQAKVGEKSPYLGALFSGIIPGTGEFYSKHYLKGAIFLAIETGLWIAYGSFQSKGNEQTDQYEAFANQNWSLNKYAQWLVQQGFSGSGAISDPLTSNLEVLRRQVNTVEAQNFSHQLPPFGDQQYYELIGKYQNFVPGWGDADLMVVNRNNYITYKTSMYSSYSVDRQQANDYYNNASTMTSLVIVNHILSAADAAWSVSMFNKNLKVKTGVHMENKYSYLGERKLIPVANLNVTF
ncbi:MAG: hypothetical protein M3R36_10190 [Bacteroidota bacterium]|nr:hypothetical protein [Bacteroidota bacterium]